MNFFKSAFDWFKKVFTNPSWIHAAQVAITVVAPLVETVAQLAGGTDVGAQVTGIMNTVKVDLGVATTTLGQIQASPGNVNALMLLKNTLASIKDNLQALLQVAAIKDPNTKQTVTLTVNTIIGEVDAILASIPSAA